MSQKIDEIERDGWTRVDDDELEGFGPYLGGIAPIWRRPEAGGPAYGMLAQPQHANRRRIVHGGAICTFIDHAIGLATRRDDDDRSKVTVQLSTFFVSAAEIGDFIEGRGEIIRDSRSLIFVRGLITVGPRTIATAEGIWKRVSPR